MITDFCASGENIKSVGIKIHVFLSSALYEASAPNFAKSHGKHVDVVMRTKLANSCSRTASLFD
jgi:hypothetical protein